MSNLASILGAERVRAFWARVDVGAVDACWLWKGALDRENGYGAFHAGVYGTRGAHRVAYALDRGLDLPTGRSNHVCHHCDNPPCVNPAHLFAGTPLDNIRDAIAKGRLTQLYMHRGKPSPRRVISDELLREALKVDTRTRKPGTGLRALAERHGINHNSLQAAVWKARHGGQRAHVASIGPEPDELPREIGSETSSEAEVQR